MKPNAVFHRLHRRTAGLAGTAAALVLLTACGGGSDDDGTPALNHPVISDETARLRRMDAPESTAATTPAAAPASARRRIRPTAR